MVVDALRVFTLAFAQNMVLQLVKDLHVHGLASFPTALLGMTIVFAHVSSSEMALMNLAASAVLVLALHGSASNHVVLEAIVALGILFTAPYQTPHLDRASRRALWSERLTVCMRAVLCALYLVTGFAKLNDGWHDPRYSCCVHMFVGVIGFFSPASIAWLPSSLLRVLPYLATAFEMGFPLALLGALAHRARGADSATASLPLRCLTVAGCAFHVLIALPPPPISVYPFSMLMVPIYVPSLLPDEVGCAARAVAAWPRRVHTAIAAVLAAAIAGAIMIHHSSTRFEYPPYFAWELGALWTLGTFGALAAVALGVVSAAHGHGPSPSPPSRSSAAVAWHPRLWLTLAPAACLVAIGSCTYLGVRTYPSFAMFSNLVLEGGVSNHWLMRAPSRADAGASQVVGAPRASTRGMNGAYGAHVALEIVQTNLPSLRDLQINLAPLLPAHVLGAFTATNVSAEFHITPPSWGYAPTEPFRSFAVPLVEVRRRLAVARRTTRDFYVRYRTLDAAGRGGVREFRRRAGKLVHGSDARLEEPLPILRAAIHRYRTFDTAYAPCRH